MQITQMPGVHTTTSIRVDSGIPFCKYLLRSDFKTSNIGLHPILEVFLSHFAGAAGPPGATDPPGAAGMRSLRVPQVCALCMPALPSPICSTQPSRPHAPSLAGMYKTHACGTPSVTDPPGAAGMRSLRVPQVSALCMPALPSPICSTQPPRPHAPSLAGMYKTHACGTPGVTDSPGVTGPPVVTGMRSWRVPQVCALCMPARPSPMCSTQPPRLRAPSLAGMYKTHACGTPDTQLMPASPQTQHSCLRHPPIRVDPSCQSPIRQIFVQLHVSARHPIHRKLIKDALLGAGTHLAGE